MLEAVFLISIVVLPVVAGAVTAYLGRPWWWAAVVAVVLLFVFAIAPPPEEGESRFVAEDIVFLVFVAAIATALVWAGAFLGRRLRASRAAGPA